MTRKSVIRSRALLVVLSVIAVSAFACSTWERRIFQTLSASKAVIDQAVEDYNIAAIPQTKANADLIDKARRLDGDAVKSFNAYWLSKQAVLLETDPARKATAEQILLENKNAVIAATAAVNSIIADISKLGGKK